MQVVVDMASRARSVALAEPADCGRFHVTVRGDGDAAALDAALRANDVGMVDGDGEAWCAVDAVRRLAAGSVGPTWEDDFAAMLDYARSKGWLSDDGATDPGPRGVGVVS